MTEAGAVLSNRLRYARAEAQMTQDEVAQALDVRLATVSDWETGKVKPNLDRLEQVAKLYGKPIVFFFTEGSPGESLAAYTVEQIVEHLHERTSRRASPSVKAKTEKAAQDTGNDDPDGYFNCANSRHKTVDSRLLTAAGAR